MSTQVSPEPLRAPNFYWSGRPVYRCRACGAQYERIDNLDAVLAHELEAHPTPEPAVRQSPILGADGKPLTVVEEDREP